MYRCVDTQRAAPDLVWSGIGADVVVLYWPDEADKVERVGVPRLLLVEQGVAPPTVTSCLEDWLRLPAHDADIRARLVALAERAARHPAVTALDEHGQLSHRDATVFLSPIDQGLAEVLVANFGRPVATADLTARAWPQGGSGVALRVHVSRLRRHIAPLGLQIRSIRGYGYVLRDGPAVSAAVDEVPGVTPHEEWGLDPSPSRRALTSTTKDRRAW
jgi:DNA-binding winged helix-turn-helix (wHTH) protein